MDYSGTILRGSSFEPVEGTISVVDGTIDEISPEPTDSETIIAPAFVNAHTHLGDSIAKEAGEGLTLEELVAPPDGLKHRLLEAADDATLVDGMGRSLRYAARSGSVACYDFREGGRDGVDLLREAATGVPIDAVALGRGPPDVVEHADGYGASGANDDDFAEARQTARAAGKPFGIHAGEASPDDLDPALDLDPDFLVHVVHPEPTHLDRIESTGTPVVVCPRSNHLTRVGRAPIETLVDRTTVALGTDNAMLNAPNMFREMAFVATITDCSTVEVLGMATRNGATLLGRRDGVLEPGRPANLVLLDGDSDNLVGYRDPVRALVRRATVEDVIDVIYRGSPVSSTLGTD